MEVEYKVVAENHAETFERNLNGWAMQGFRVIQFQLSDEHVAFSERDLSPLFAAIMERTRERANG